MLTVICNKHNKVTVRKKDGSQSTIIRCADAACVYFTKEVTDEQCITCPRHLEVVTTIHQPETAATGNGNVVKTFELVPTAPNLFRRSVTWAEAMASWILAGRPERSDEEVQNIFQKYCKACSWYDSKKQICRGCGCNVNDYGHPAFNKIKMATQHCPRTLW